MSLLKQGSCFDALYARYKISAVTSSKIILLQFEEVGAGNICISAKVLAELYYGAARHPKGIVIRREIDNFVSRLVVIPWDETAADHIE